MPDAYAIVFPSGSTTGKTAGIVVSTPATIRGMPPLLGTQEFQSPIRSGWCPLSSSTDHERYLGIFASGMLAPPSTDTFLICLPST